MFFLALILLAITIPPAAKVLAVMGAVYGFIALLKKSPAVTPYLTGMVAVILNVVVTVLGLLIALPANQLYTMNTLLLIITTVLGSAGIHGTVKAFSPPQVLATIPPDTKPQEVPATLVPNDPKAQVVESEKKS